MPAGQHTITRRTQDLHQQVLKPVVQGVKKSPYWSLIADEATDSSTHEQFILFVRYINLQEQKIIEEFLEIKRIVGHPNAANLFTAVMECIEKEAVDDSLPTEKRVGLTTDDTSVMVSTRGGVYGKLKQAVNSKLFLTHCPPHRLILALKAGQKVLPGDIEKTVADVLYFFKMNRDEFHFLKELVEPNNQYNALVQYHRIRWLSFSDCVSRLVKLLPLLVRYFEEQALDTSNRQEVQTKCRCLHTQLSEPRFQLFLFSLEPQLEVLAKMNKWLQTSSLSLHEVYSKIKALLSTFVQLISLDVTKS